MACIYALQHWSRQLRCEYVGQVVRLTPGGPKRAFFALVSFTHQVVRLTPPYTASSGLLEPTVSQVLLVRDRATVYLTLQTTNVLGFEKNGRRI